MYCSRMGHAWVTEDHECRVAVRVTPVLSRNINVE